MGGLYAAVNCFMLRLRKTNDGEALSAAPQHSSTAPACYFRSLWAMLLSLLCQLHLAGSTS
jgi:hypothetical protein